MIVVWDKAALFLGLQTYDFIQYICNLWFPMETNSNEFSNEIKIIRNSSYYTNSM